jgi:SpoVK/Ycf46/Vps4 family AAA+-type ATPase
LQRFRPNKLSEFQLPLLGKVSKDFSGAEIEQVVIEAMRLGFNEKREFATRYFVFNSEPYSFGANKK